jgi:hypothetical protein
VQVAAELIPLARGHFPKSIHNGDKFALENACATIPARIGFKYGTFYPVQKPDFPPAKLFVFGFFLLGCFFTAELATLIAVASSPVFAKTELAVLAHCFFVAGLLAFFVCLLALSIDHGIVFSFTRVQGATRAQCSALLVFTLTFTERCLILLFWLCHGFTLSEIRDFAPVNVIAHLCAKKQASNCRQNSRCSRHKP